MRKILLATVLVFASVLAFSQTAARTFQCNIKKQQSLSLAAITGYIAHGKYESYRLKDKNNTLVFDNGFEIVLFSASDMHTKGLITNVANYPAEFPAGFVMPVFHMTPDGKVGAEYPVINSKYSTQNR